MISHSLGYLKLQSKTESRLDLKALYSDARATVELNLIKNKQGGSSNNEIKECIY